MVQDKVYNVMIAKNVTHDATSIATLDNGEIQIVKPDMTLMTAGETISDAEFFYIVQGVAAGQSPKFSAKLQGVNIQKWEGKSYATAVQQVSYVGDNGTDDVTPETNNTEYVLHIIFTHDKSIWSQRQHKKTFHYTTDASATKAEIYAAFADLINNDKETKELVVAAVFSTNGLRITGLTQTANLNENLDDNEIVTFKLAVDGGFVDPDHTLIDEFGVNSGAASPGTPASVTPDRGIGTGRFVFDLERRAQGYEGITNTTFFPVPNFPKFADLAGTYDIYSIEAHDIHESANLDKRLASPIQVYTAIPQGTGAGTNFESLLNPYMLSTPKGFAPITL
jgi:hypothetical protein